jgi:FkbM family methyltransferase
MKNYSQNDEQKHILEFFNGKKGTLLSIGENDGQTYSNAYALIQLGWVAVLVEPSETAFSKLQELHKGNKNVGCYQIAIGNKSGTTILHQSGAHILGGNDVALVSSINKSETERWQKNGVDFKDIVVQIQTFKIFKMMYAPLNFDFITIDAEGMDIDILKQIDLSNTQLLCIEWNSKEEIKKEIVDYTSIFGMDKIIYKSGENLLIAR